MSKSVMGIDTSTNSLAFCIYSEEGQPVKWGEIFFGGKTVDDRIITGAQVIRELKDGHGEFNVDTLALEATVFVNNRQVVIAMAHALGMIISALGNHNIVRYPPVSWQSAIGNKLMTKAEKDLIAQHNPGKSKTWLANERRNIRKQRTIDWVKETYGIEIESDNVADAFGVGYKGWQDVNS